VPLRAVLWDFNGTLVDDEPIHARLFAEVAAEAGLAAWLPGVEIVGRRDREGFADLIRARSGQADDALADRLVARKAARYAAIAAAQPRACRGAVRLARAAAARWPQALVSGALRGEIVAALDALGLRTAFRVIVAGEDVALGKPDPEGFLAAAARLGRVAAADCLAIEDSPPGAEAARRAGMAVLAVATSFPPARLAPLAERVVATLEEVGPGDLEDLLAARRAPAGPA
jgi:beta-phosphoglucomutase